MPRFSCGGELAHAHFLFYYLQYDEFKNQCARGLQEAANLSTYLQVYDNEQPGGDMPCGSKEKCRTLSVRSVTQAKVLCDTYRDKCKGFVYEAKSRKFSGKIDITGMELHLGQSYFYTSGSSINFTLTKVYQGNTAETVCSIHIEDWR